MANTVGDGVAQSRNFGWQPVLELTCDQMRCPGYKWLLFFHELKEFMKKTKFSDDEDVICTACGCSGWNTKNNNSSTTVSELWRNAGLSAFQLQGSMLKSDKIWCAYLVVNCVSLRTFWTPLVHVFATGSNKTNEWFLTALERIIGHLVSYKGSGWGSTVVISASNCRFRWRHFVWK